MKKLLALLLIFCLCFPLGGCTHRLDLCLMVVAIGIDLSDTDIRITVKSPDYSAGEKGGGEEGGAGYLTLSSTGVDWSHAYMQLVSTAPLSLRFGQLREVVVSQSSLDRMPLKQLLGFVDHLQNVRSHAMVIICREDAKTFVENQTPAIGKRLSKYLDLSLQQHERSGLIPTTTLGSALRDMACNWSDPLFAYAALSGGEQPPAQGEPLSLTGGDVSSDGEKDAQYVGALAMGCAGEYTLLTGFETQLYHLIIGKDQQLLFQLGAHYYAAKPRGNARMRIEKTGGKDTLVLSLPVTVIHSLYAGMPGDGAAAFLEAEIVALIKKLQSVGCDALGYGSLAVRSYDTLYQWQASAWPERYRDAEVRVEVSVRCRQENAL